MSVRHEQQVWGAGTLIRLRCSCGRVEAQGSELAVCREMQLTSTMQLWKFFEAGDNSADVNVVVVVAVVSVAE